MAQLDDLAGYTTVNKGVKFHTDTYFDTEDFLLFRGKIVLRLRMWENNSALTFKAAMEPTARPSEEGIYRRREIECETDAKIEDIVLGLFPELPPLKALDETLRQVVLFPSLTVKNHRRIILLAKREIPYYEMALDDVIFSGQGGEKGVCELEVEALSEKCEDLGEIGAWLAERFDLKPAGPSKYILGMELVGGITENGK